MSTLCRIALVVLVAVGSAPADACDAGTGERRQMVFLDWNGRYVEHWTVEAGRIHRVELPTGFALGVRIEPAGPAAHAGAWTRGEHVPELVRIALFDLGGAAPVELTWTVGGANSVQGYSASGGADSVEPLGDPGIRLTLLKPVCEPGPVDGVG